MTANVRIEPLGATYDDLKIVGELVTLRFAPGSEEAERVAHVRQLLDVSADLSYAISTYTHRILMFAGRRPGVGDLRDETAALQDSIEAFIAQVRRIANTYRAAVSVEFPARPTLALQSSRAAEASSAPSHPADVNASAPATR